MSPNAGTGETGVNSVSHVIPRNGDQVMISFQERNKLTLRLPDVPVPSSIFYFFLSLIQSSELSAVSV